MTVSEKRKFLEAIEQVERQEGIDSGLSPRALVGFTIPRFPEIWDEVKEAFAIEQAVQIVAQRGGAATRTRRPNANQLSFDLPGSEPVKVSASIWVPNPPRKGQPVNLKHGRWGKTLEVSVSDFGLYLRRETLRLKNATDRQRQTLQGKRKLYQTAVTAAHGNLSLSMGEALALREAKRAARKAHRL